MFHPPEGKDYMWYILPIGGLYATYLPPFRGTISTTIDICAVFCLPFPPLANFLDSSMLRKIEACLLPLEADEKAG